MKYEKQTFDGVDIVLDGNEYWNCTFNKCRVIFRGLQGHTLANPTFNGCAWHFDGPAGNTLAFLSAVYGSGADGKRLIETVLAEIRKGNPSKTFH